MTPRRAALGAEDSAEVDTDQLWDWTDEADRSQLRSAASSLLRALGLVAVDPEFVERVREAERRAERLGAHNLIDVERARLALADAVLEQLGGGR